MRVRHGKRYNRETLDIRFKGKTIADVLDMPIEEALEFFAHIPKIKRRGAGAARRRAGLHAARAARDDAVRRRGAAGQAGLRAEQGRNGQDALHPDELTTGLHFADIQRLLEVLQRLVDQGNSVVVIEHNLDVIKTADRIIDMGPEGGDDGGEPRRGRHARGGRGGGGLLHGPLPGRHRRAQAPGLAGAAAPEGRGGGVRDPDATADCASAERESGDPEWSAPPLATAERLPGQEPRTRDLRADGD